jgi:ABC-type branched-subunit amino acid transport system substrate-binding protein
VVHISGNPTAPSVPTSTAPPPTAPPSSTAPPSKKRRVSRAVAAIIVVVVLVAAGVGGYYVYKYYTASSSSNTITVGMPLPLNSLIGQNMLDAAQLAVNQINGAGGVSVGGTSYQYKIVTYDTEEADPSIPIANGISGVTSLITNDHVNFLMGGYRSDVVLAELPIVAQYKELYITFGADTGISQYVAQNYSSGGEYIFNGFLNTTNQNAQYGALPVFLLEAYNERATTHFDTNVTNIAVLGEQAAWTKADIGGGGPASPLWPVLKSVGFNPVYIEQFPLSPPGGSYDSLFSTLAADGTQAIYMLAAGTETPLLISNFGSFNWGADTALQPGAQRPLLLGADVMSEFNGTSSTNNYFKMTNGACAGEMTFGWGPTLPYAITSNSIAFYNDFESAYGINPMFADGFVYSAFYYLAAAITKAGSLAPLSVIPYLQQTDYTGPMGVVQFSSSHGLVIPINATYPNPDIPAFGMQWHANGELYPLWSSLWSTPNFLAADTFATGSTVSFENYQAPNGTEYQNGDFSVVL